MAELPILRFNVEHQGFGKDASSRARSSFTHAARTALYAAMGLYRWPHRPVWGPQRVARARIVIRPPAKLEATQSHPTIISLLSLLAVAADDVTKIDVISIVGKHRQPIAVEILALLIEDVPDVAERAATAARAESSTPRAALRSGEPLPADTYAAMGVRVPAPKDWIEQQLEDEEAARARERSADPNAVTPKTLQRETPLDAHSSSSKGRRRASTAPPPTASELNARFDRETRDLEMLSPISDIDRARTALEESARRIEQHGPGAPLKGRSPRIKVHGRIPADLIVACASLGPDLESILAATATALATGALYVPPKAEIA